MAEMSNVALSLDLHLQYFLLPFFLIFLWSTFHRSSKVFELQLTIVPPHITQRSVSQTRNTYFMSPHKGRMLLNNAIYVLASNALLFIRSIYTIISIALEGSLQLTEDLFDLPCPTPVLDFALQTKLFTFFRDSPL